MLLENSIELVVVSERVLCLERTAIGNPSRNVIRLFDDLVEFL